MATVPADLDSDIDVETGDPGPALRASVIALHAQIARTGMPDSSPLPELSAWLPLAADISEAGFSLRDIRAVDTYYVTCMVRIVAEERGASPQDIRRRDAAVRSLCVALGQPDLLPPLTEIVRPEALAPRIDPQSARAVVGLPASVRLSRRDEARLESFVASVRVLDRPGGVVEQHARRPKSVGRKTQYERRRFHLMIARQLYELGFRPESLRALRRDHIVALARLWERQGLTAATLQTRISFLRTLGRRLGKLELVPAREALFENPAVYRRVAAATSEKTWSAQDVDLDGIFEQIYAEEPHIAVQLMMMWAFGLRTAEAACIRPHQADVRVGLDVRHGTKNGRSRFVQIEAGEVGERQRAILELAKSYTCPPHGSLIPARYDSLRRWKNRFYYVLKKCGVTRAQLGITAHGLRHEYAAELYERISGLERPLSRVRALSEREGRSDRQARAAVSAALGHARISITGAYLGSSRDRRGKGKRGEQEEAQAG